MQSRVRASIAIVVALTSLGAVSERVREPGVTDTEIRIGNVMPYSGSLEVFGAIGKAEAAYFDMINERGGMLTLFDLPLEWDVPVGAGART